MDGLNKGESHSMAEDFKTLPVKNRVNLIKAAKSLLEVQKAYRKTSALTGVPGGAAVGADRQV
jgi:hypothetical protein